MGMLWGAILVRRGRWDRTEAYDAIQPRPLPILQEVLEWGWLSKLSHMRQDTSPLYLAFTFWRGGALYRALLCSQGQALVRDTGVSYLLVASRGEPNLWLVSSHAQNLFLIEILHMIMIPYNIQYIINITLKNAQISSIQLHEFLPMCIFRQSPLKSRHWLNFHQPAGFLMSPPSFTIFTKVIAIFTSMTIH